LVTSEGALSWTFRHPTVGDAYATLIAEDPELLDIYLSGAKVDRILEEVVCGERLVQGAKVVIPESRYRTLEERLRKVPADSDGLRHFIASRCAERFVRKFVTDRPEIVSTLGGATFFSAHSSSSLLAVRLYELGLLPEEHRRRLVKTARDQVVTGRNADFLSAPKARGLFLESEIDIILNDATTELLLNIEDEVELWAAEYQPQDDPEDHFEPLKGCLAVLHEELSDREEVVGAFRNAYRAIDMAVEGLRELYNEDQDSDYEYVEAADETPDSATSQRSVFDDIDE
jgi:hypothetical protein